MGIIINKITKKYEPLRIWKPNSKKLKKKQTITFNYEYQKLQFITEISK